MQLPFPHKKVLEVVSLPQLPNVGTEVTAAVAGAEIMRRLARMMMQHLPKVLEVTCKRFAWRLQRQVWACKGRDTLPVVPPGHAVLNIAVVEARGRVSLVSAA
jgi:hypothetical protein